MLDCNLSVVVTACEATQLSTQVNSAWPPSVIKCDQWPIDRHGRHGELCITWRAVDADSDHPQ